MGVKWAQSADVSSQGQHWLCGLGSSPQPCWHLWHRAPSCFPRAALIPRDMPTHPQTLVPLIPSPSHPSTLPSVSKTSSSLLIVNLAPTVYLAQWEPVKSPDVLFPVSGTYFRFLRLILQVWIFSFFSIHPAAPKPPALTLACIIKGWECHF